MKDFIAQNGGLLATILAGIVCFNFVLMGVQKALEVIKDKTASNLDNVAYSVIHSVTSFLQVVIDWGTGNRAH